MVNSPIESTLTEIAKRYEAGTLPWLKRNRPDAWERLLRLELRINTAALEKDKKGLTEALTEYETLIGEMVKTFKTPVGETGSLNFGKGPQSL